tara:strand:- start:25617 stop:26441 length:825 start_codon:yes stop_codon:yes gene_type:complete
MKKKTNYEKITSNYTDYLIKKQSNLNNPKTRKIKCGSIENNIDTSNINHIDTSNINNSQHKKSDYIILKSNHLRYVRDIILEKQDYKCAVCHVTFPDHMSKSSLCADQLSAPKPVQRTQKKQKLAVACLDHHHKRRKLDEINPLTGAGFVRGVLCSACNICEGKISRCVARYKGCNTDLPTLLRQIANYLDEGHYPIVHPREAPAEPNVSKRQYNLLKKKIDKHNDINCASPTHVQRAKFITLPRYPRRKKLTKALKLLFERFHISPYLKKITE